MSYRPRERIISSVFQPGPQLRIIRPGWRFKHRKPDLDEEPAPLAFRVPPCLSQYVFTILWWQGANALRISKVLFPVCVSWAFKWRALSSLVPPSELKIQLKASKPFRKQADNLPCLSLAHVSWFFTIERWWGFPQIWKPCNLKTGQTVVFALIWKPIWQNNSLPMCNHIQLLIRCSSFEDPNSHGQQTKLTRGSAVRNRTKVASWMRNFWTNAIISDFIHFS